MQGQLREDLTRISTRSSDKDLYKIMQESLKEDLTRISSISSYKDLREIMQGALGGCLQDLGEDFHLSRTSKTAPRDSL